MVPLQLPASLLREIFLLSYVRVGMLLKSMKQLIVHKPFKSSSKLRSVAYRAVVPAIWKAALVYQTVADLICVVITNLSPRAGLCAYAALTLATAVAKDKSC